MATYRIRADRTGPRTYKKELQMISYRGDGLYSDEGNTLISEKDVYYPGDYLAQDCVSVVTDSLSFKEDGVSTKNKFSRGRPAALGVIEQFPDESEVSKSLLGINRAETQQGIFDNVSSYGLSRKDWIVYSGFPDYDQPDFWENKNSPAGPHDSVKDYDDASGSSVVITSYPVPYLHPGNAPIGQAITGQISAPPVGWGRYLQSLVAMYVIEYMVNNFTIPQKERFKISFLEKKYPKNLDGTFNRLYWDQIWNDITQGRFEENANIPIIPKGRFVNFTFPSEESGEIDLIESLGSTIDNDSRIVNVDYRSLFFATTRYTWIEPDKGHYRLMTNPNTEVWEKYWGIDYNSLPQELRDWEFRVFSSSDQIPQYINTYKLPYYLIEDSEVAYDSLVFSSSWPQAFSDPNIPQTRDQITSGNRIGGRESSYSVITLTSARAFRYQPGRISGFTYGVRVSEEGAGPGTVLEWGVENFTDGYFFRLKDGTDFSIVRRSTIPLGITDVFIQAGYEEREAYVVGSTGVIRYADEITQTEKENLDNRVLEGSAIKVYETIIQQNQMNGDGLNGQGDSGYIYNPDTVTMYKIEFGWYGAIGARFYVYLPVDNANARWVEVHTLVIENQIGQPCLEDPFFFFKYRVYIDNPSRIRLPQFIEKYGASYYIDGGDEGTVSIGSNKAINRPIQSIADADIEIPTYSWTTVAGIKPKSVIVNTEGNKFKNKKEIFPVSLSLSSSVDAEVKLINQFACQEHAFTFQEGFYCSLPEEQKLRGVFSINRLRSDETSLSLLGRNQNDPTPTIIFIRPDERYPESSTNLIQGGEFIGWDAFNNSLHGSHLIGEDLYLAYLNPTEEGSGNPVGFDGNEIVINRFIETPSVFSGLPRNAIWSDAALLFRYQNEVPLKISQFRKDTTLISSVGISNNEFYLLFTRNITDSRDPDSSDHFGDLQVGIIWPSPEQNPSYPLSQISQNRDFNDFGIINPDNPNDQGLNNSDVQVSLDNEGWHVIDKKIPNSLSYKYYEGLPIDITSSGIRNNTLLLNQYGDLGISAQGLEVNEFDFSNNTSVLGLFDAQFPLVPGEDGGRCHVIQGRVGELSNECTLTNTDVNGTVITGQYYLSSVRPWPSDLWGASNTILIETDSGSEYRVSTIAGSAQQIFTPQGSRVRLYLLPIIFLAPEPNPFPEMGIALVAKYRGVSLYTPGISQEEKILLAQKIVGTNIFPIRFFIRMRDGARVGAISVGQLTRNGIIQNPFTPHGCTLSARNIDNIQDSHLVSGVEPNNSAKKSIVAFSHPGALTTNNYSYYDVSGPVPDLKYKKCPSFLSQNPLSGTGFSSTGDYPLRWLKFKESGDAVASYFVKANENIEIDLSSIFGVNTESIGPSFWNNKSLFIISRSLEENVSGKINLTLNYKEQ